MANESRAAANRRKNVAMAARLRAEGVVRNGGICVICYRPIGNDNAAENHYTAHAWGNDSN